MKFVRHFTAANTDPYFDVEFVERESKIVGKGGRVVFQAKILAPKSWGQLAVDMLAQKYTRKAGVPTEIDRVEEVGVPAWLSRGTPREGATFGGETDARQVFDRLAGHWTYWGWQNGYFDSEDDARVFFDEHRRLLVTQAAAPNSPQWFNVGLYWAYGIEGENAGQFAFTPTADGSDVTVATSPAPYVRPGASACHINAIDDSLLGAGGIMDFATREARVFKYGSGSGANYSGIRGRNEPLSGGGLSSGLQSFLPPLDRFAGAIKSGGTCLAPHTRVFTESGPTQVKELAESGRSFVCLSYDPPAGRYKAKKARAWLTGRKTVVRVTTDKATFDVTYDHPMKLADGGYVEAGLLTEGIRLFACHVADRNGYLRVSLRTGKRGGGSRYWHRLIAEDVMGANKALAVDHVDGDKRNNQLNNLSLVTPSEHATRHAKDAVDAGNHVFQTRTFPKPGSSNPMAATSDFWTNATAVAAYKEKQSLILKGSGRAADMAQAASRQRMLNIAWKLINLGCDIGTFELYADARQKHVARLDSVARLKRDIESRFGSYPQFLREVNESNHRVVSVVTMGEMDVYDVQVDCPTVDDRTEETGHNFVIWPDDNPVGSGVCVHNTRRAARMVVLDMDHPDIEWFTTWKAREEKKVAMLVAGAGVCRKAVAEVHAAKKAGKEQDLTRALEEAVEAGVPYGILDQAIQLAAQGLAPPDVPEMDVDYLGEAYETVTGQNANNSVGVPKAFMDAVRADADWPLYWRTEKVAALAENRPPVPCKTVKARKLWDDVARAAWESADPGTQYHDTMDDWNPVKNDGMIKQSNPCCLIGSTLVDTSEGKITIERLTAMADNGETLPYAFAYDTEAGRPVLRKILRAWKAGEAQRLVRVTTDRGVTLVATPEHRFLTYDGKYVCAENLMVGTSLRKIARHVNTRRSGRVLVSDKGCGNPNGAEYQNRWMWEQINGPVPDGYEIHHVNEDTQDDRISNFECIESIEHKSLHAAGDNNNRWIDADESELLRVWDYLTDHPNQKRSYGDHTPVRWNKAIDSLGLKGKVPKAQSPTLGGRVRGMTWDEFRVKMTNLRANANDKVVAIEAYTPDIPTPVYDIEVEGVHNFACTDKDVRGDATIVVHNSEYLFLVNTSCNLWCLNLVALVHPTDWAKTAADLQAAVRLTTVALDITVGLAGYPAMELARGAGLYRTLGLGYANLGALLMRNGIPYDSDAGRGWAACLTGLVHFGAALVSAEMAAQLGTFPRYKANAEHVERVWRNHAAYLTTKKYVGLTVAPVDPTVALAQVPKKLLSWTRQVVADGLNAVLNTGLRNAQLTLIMPAGTVGLLMGCDTTGVEPDFSLLKGKALADGGYVRIVNESVGPALTHLGYGPDAVEKFVSYVNETGTIEGAPGFKAEHLPVFDCANKCGKIGTRYIHADGHLRMMAAVQPLLSGGISKTINLPADCTVADVRKAYENAHDWMIKCVALYRDGSKLSQPLSSVGGKEVAKVSGPKPMTKGERRHLPNRRYGHTQKFRTGGHKFYLKTGEYKDGTLGEVFLICDKEGGFLQAVASIWAKTASIGLQYGVPLEELVSALLGTRFEPNGPVMGHERLKNCTSIFDAIARHLAVEYLGRDDLAHVQKADKAVEQKHAPLSGQGEEKFEGTPCLNCGLLKLRRDGKCSVCVNCGTTTGCS